MMSVPAFARCRVGKRIGRDVITSRGGQFFEVLDAAMPEGSVMYLVRDFGFCETLASMGGKYDPDPRVLTPAEERELKHRQSERVRKAKRDEYGRFVTMKPKSAKAANKIRS